MTTSDCSFSIGKTHTICQDYARAGIRDGQPYVFLSDGCSSSPDCDVGARLLVLAAEKFLLLDSPTREYLVSRAAYATTMAYASIMALGLPISALDATLAFAMRRGKTIYAGIHGDGLIAWKQRGNADICVLQTTSIKNYPDYLSYKILPERRVVASPMIETVTEQYQVAPDGKKREIKATYSGEAYACLPADSVDFLAVISDGATSFVHKVNTSTSRIDQPVPFVSLVHDMLGFKSLNGVFVQRRMQKFAKECREKGYEHYDDLAIGAIA